jgi:prevent-host-death family protein
VPIIDIEYEHKSKTISASEFRTHCPALLNQVAHTRRPLVVTKRGKSVAKIIPAESHVPRKLLGSVKFHGNMVDPILTE